MRGVIGLAVYLIALFATALVDYWWFVAFVLLSPVIATAIAFKNTEFWPVVHPQYGFFWGFPAIFVVYRLVLDHPREWGEWLGWSLLVSLAITAVWTVRFRRDIDRHWAVFGTLAAVFALVAFGLSVANLNLGGQSRSTELATVITESPGGYRQPARITVSTSSRDRETFFPGWRGYFAFGEGDVACVHRYSGALGWGWDAIAPCTDEEIFEAATISSE